MTSHMVMRSQAQVYAVLNRLNCVWTVNATTSQHFT